MIFNIPTTGDFDKFNTKKNLKNLEKVFLSLDKIKKKRVRSLSFPNKTNAGLPPKQIFQVFLQALVHRIVALAEGAVLAWNAENGLLAALSARSLVETVVMSFYVFHKTKELSEKEEYQKIIEVIVTNMSFFRNFEGKSRGKPPPSIAKLIDYFDKNYLGKKKEKYVRKQYEFLSQFVHPNWVGTQGLFAILIASENRFYFGPQNSVRPQVFAEIKLAFGLIQVFEDIVSDIEILISKIGKKI